MSSFADEEIVSRKPIIEARGVLISWLTFAINEERTISKFFTSVIFFITIRYISLLGYIETLKKILVGEIS